MHRPAQSAPSFRPIVEALEDRITPTTLPAGFSETLVTTGSSLSAPTAMDFSPTNELWVLEQDGAVKLVRGDGTTHTAIDLAVDNSGERGLLGIAFDPSYDGAGPNADLVFLYYTVPSPAHNRISRFTVTGAGSATPTLTAETAILDLENLSGATNHNGGAIHFGLDGKLYVAVGDNNDDNPNQTQQLAQVLTSRFGKMLRINPDGSNPNDNPFFTGGDPIQDSIWALGLRNPFTFAVNQGSGAIFINDVGEQNWEEINLGSAGANYGWAGSTPPLYEGFIGTHPFATDYEDPLMAYDHSNSAPTPFGCAIAGGVFYPADGVFGPQLAGNYFFADLCGGFIRRFDPSNPGSVGTPDTSTAFADDLTGRSPVDLKVDAAGNLYYLSRTAGAVFRISFASSPLADSLAASAGYTVVGATGSPTSILSVKIFDGSGNLVDAVSPFDNLTSLRVAAGDFDGDGKVDEFAVLGRRTGSDLRAEIVTYDLSVDGQATETGRFFAFAPGILGNGFITAGDFDGDGDDDLAVAQIGGGRAVVNLQVHISTDGVFSAGGAVNINFGIIAAPRLGAGDTDGDGLDEIVVAVRTPQGARVLVFDVNEAFALTQQGAGFFWDFGVDGYARGAFVAVGEFDASFAGEEIVLGSNVGGGGRVDIVSYDGEAATLSANGRLAPFGDGYNAAVRVAVGMLADDISRPILIAGQDRFQDGAVVALARGFNFEIAPQPAAPGFQTIPPFTVLIDDDGLAPPSGSGDRTLGPFVAFANPGLVRAHGSTGVIAAGGTETFSIDGSVLAPPAGALFNDPDNRLFVNTRLSGGNLANVSLVLSARDAGGALLQQANLTNALPGVAVADLQFGDGQADNAAATGDLLFGFFAPVDDLDDFFTADNVTSLDGLWELTVVNNTGTPITLEDWELTLAFDV